MKCKITLLITILFLILSNGLVAQTYTCTIQNQTVNGTNFSYDIYMQRTDATEIYLGQSEFSVNFNNINFSSPAVSYVVGTSMVWYTVDVAIPSGFDNVVKFTVGALFFNNQSEFDSRVCKPSTTAPGTLVATVTISGISNPSGNAGISWRTTAPHDSKVNTYASTDPWGLTNITENGTYTDPPNSPLPVELENFTASTKVDEVILNWKTATEVNNYGFEIERAAPLNPPEGGGGNIEWEKIGFVEGNGNSNSPKQYKYTDKNPLGGSKFIYRLKQIDNDGTYSYSDEVEVELLPVQYKLYQNYPNPFNPTTNIKFSLPENAKVNIRIYNTLGELVTELVNKEFEAGYHKVEFNANNLASGIYFYRLSTSKFSSVKKMLLIK